MGKLQWGHDKIVMEVIDSALECISRCWLQWGHDKIVMEVPQLTDNAEPDDPASMGP